jgi:hypothetical protein
MTLRHLRLAIRRPGDTPEYWRTRALARSLVGLVLLPTRPQIRDVVEQANDVVEERVSHGSTVEEAILLAATCRSLEGSPS